MLLSTLPKSLYGGLILVIMFALCFLLVYFSKIVYLFMLKNRDDEAVVDEPIKPKENEPKAPVYYILQKPPTRKKKKPSPKPQRLYYVENPQNPTKK